MKRGSDDDINSRNLKKSKFEYGESGERVSLRANYFSFHKLEKFILSQYRVDFDPDIEVTNIRRGIIKSNEKQLGLNKNYLFDGSSIYSTSIFEECIHKINYNNQPMEVSIRHVGTILADSIQANQIYNLIMREAMAALKLQNIRRNYYDPQMKINVSEANLDLWPGYLTATRQYENHVLLNVEIIHKFMRRETIIDITRDLMKKHDRRDDWRDALQRAVIGTTVLTDYSNKTYLIDDIDFESTPRSSFKTSSGVDKTYAQYYSERYKIEIKDLNQFLLVSRARERDIRAGLPELIYLIPELCRATGLTDKMRSNFHLMQAISAYTRMNPEQRVDTLNRFNQRLYATPESLSILSDWNVQLSQQLVKIEARELKPETIIFGRGHEEVPNARAEWIISDRSGMYKSVDSVRWVFLYPKEIENVALTFLKTLRTVAERMDFKMDDPLHRAIYDDRQDSYIKEIDSVARKNPTMILIALPTNRADRYSSVKHRCLVDHGIACQIVVKNKTMSHRSLNSVASKIVIQMNCKMGGIPWMVKIPVKGLMTVGFDVSHHPRDKSRSVGALVSTMDLKRSSEFFSITMEYKNNNEMVSHIDNYLHAGIRKFNAITGSFPERIIFYRDGVGEGQIDRVYEQEVEPILMTLKKIYGSDDSRFAFIVVNKRSNARFFKDLGRGNFANPGPGTVIDRVVTMPNRNDFYLISQKVGQGTVAPTYYQVLHNTTGLSMDKIQILSFKFCHLYFNWAGTVRIPFVSQFAKKLAFLTCQSLRERVNPKLENTLYFL